MCKIGVTSEAETVMTVYVLFLPTILDTGMNKDIYSDIISFFAYI